MYEAYKKCKGRTAQSRYELYIDYKKCGYTISALAAKYHYHVQTVYDCIAEVERFIASYDRYKTVYLPGRLEIQSEIKSKGIVHMTFASYQYDGTLFLPREDLKTRYARIKNMVVLNRVVDRLRASTVKYAPMTVIYDLGLIPYEEDIDADESDEE